MPRAASAPRPRSAASRPAAPKPRAGRVSADDRPPPIWAPFPLTELVTLAGIALMVWGLLSGGERAVAGAWRPAWPSPRWPASSWRCAST